VFKVNTNGTGFAILRWFNSSTNGANPGAGLVLSGGALYGTTYNGGMASEGTVFRLNTDGTGYAVVKHFGGSHGATPFAGLTLSGNRLYGTTSEGGDLGLGTVFSLDLTLRFNGAVLANDGSVDVTLIGETGRRCEIYGSTNLSAWELLATLTNQTGTVLYTDAQATNLPARFYRAVQLP
jgi:uncharacterized repeat protein (TIGR03803 family)